MESGSKTVTVAEYLTKQLEICGKTQMEVAQAAGFDNPNIITMLKQGQTKVPLARVGALARVLDINAAHLMRMVLEEYIPETWRAIEEAMDRMILSEHEEQLVRRFREMRIEESAEYRVAG